MDVKYGEKKTITTIDIKVSFGAGAAESIVER